MADSRHGYSCLHAACSRGHASVVAHLLSLPCGPRLAGMRGSGGCTALDLAVAAGHAAAAEAIRAAGARPAPSRPAAAPAGRTGPGRM